LYHKKDGIASDECNVKKESGLGMCVKVLAAAERVKKNVRRKNRRIIDKEGEKVPESARIVRCEAVNAYEVSGTP
jgi:hypothetical protein